MKYGSPIATNADIILAIYMLIVHRRYVKTCLYIYITSPFRKTVEEMRMFWKSEPPYHLRFLQIATLERSAWLVKRKLLTREHVCWHASARKFMRTSLTCSCNALWGVDKLWDILGTSSTHCKCDVLVDERAWEIFVTKDLDTICFGNTPGMKKIHGRVRLRRFIPISKYFGWHRKGVLGFDGITILNVGVERGNSAL